MQFLTWLHRNLSMVRTWAGNTGLFKTETGTGTAKEKFFPNFTQVHRTGPNYYPILHRYSDRFPKNRKQDLWQVFTQLSLPSPAKNQFLENHFAINREEVDWYQRCKTPKWVSKAASYRNASSCTNQKVPKGRTVKLSIFIWGKERSSFS